MMLTKAAEYNNIAISYLQHPPDPRLSALAVAWYQRSLEVEPDCVETYVGLAKAYRQIGQLQQAWDCCDRAEAIDPQSLLPSYYRCMLQLPIVYRRYEEILCSRQQYRQQLVALGEAIARASLESVATLADIVGSITPFYLTYQGYDDLELMHLYGQIVTQIMAARYPRWARTLPIIPPKQNEPIRVGIVSGTFYRHSVWKDIIKGWITRLDRERFQLFGYSLSKQQDAETEFARSCLAKFVAGTRSTEEWGELIQADRPHLLLYPEVSMNSLAIQLSALRLAPVQATTWGTYVTSGLPTIDYFLTGEAIEPREADKHYVEKVVKLPNLSMYYTPLEKPLSCEQYPDFGLRPSAIAYFCPQSLFKYLPQYDWIYPCIAREVGDCQFIFMKHKTSEALTKIFVARLQDAFAVEGLDPNHYVVMEPTLSDANYHQLNTLADIFLDSIGVAGATTTLEAVSYTMPIVTLPGEFLRGRVSSGILDRMGVTETIATSPKAYVEIAIRLGKDTAWRQQVRTRMARNKPMIYGDRACIEELENFLESAVRGQVSCRSDDNA